MAEVKKEPKKKEEKKEEEELEDGEILVDNEVAPNRVIRTRTPKVVSITFLHFEFVGF